jgi:hypothetical protein
MGSLIRRYAHVPLGLVCLFVLAAVIVWLLQERVDAPWSSTALIAASHQAAVMIPATPSEPSIAGSSGTLGAAGSASHPLGPTAPGQLAALASAEGERFALESGPFTSAESADAREEELNRLGFSTTRFRKQDLARFYVIQASGFASAEDARRAAEELGARVVPGADGPELVLPRLASLREAVLAARALRAHGVEPRLSDEASPTVIYHIRYGQFSSAAAARSRGEELARLGLPGRVVKVR